MFTQKLSVASERVQKLFLICAFHASVQDDAHILDPKEQDEPMYKQVNTETKLNLLSALTLLFYHYGTSQPWNTRGWWRRARPSCPHFTVDHNGCNPWYIAQRHRPENIFTT